jgi:cation transporter-like permease
MSTEHDTDRERRIDAYVSTHGKSVILALLLAILAGPIGYFYVSALGGAVLTLLALFAAAAHPGLVIGVWGIAVLSAPFGAIDYNYKLRAKADLLAN